jgi:predicted transcriptional regulator YdeE
MDDKYINEQEIRIINLPQMVVASISKAGEAPEDACWLEALNLIKSYHLDKEIKNIGHGYNDANGNYTYELWIAIPKELSISLPFVKKEFSGGLYATLSCDLSNIGDKWQELQDIITQNETYEHDTDPKRDMYLEECVDVESFHSLTTKLSEKQLNLLLPIKLINKHDQVGCISEVETMQIILPDLLLCGTSFLLKEAVRPWKKRVPWYQLAQNIYKVGPGYGECMNHGNNTYTFVYGKTINSIPFYLDLNKGKVDRVFAAVELVKSFPVYPEDLENYFLSSNKYMMFSIKINPNDAKSIKLNFKDLYEAASMYFKGKEESVNDEFCLEREYRSDGRYVDKIELYIQIKNRTI